MLYQNLNIQPIWPNLYESLLLGSVVILEIIEGRLVKNGVLSVAIENGFVNFQRSTSFCNQCTGNCRRSFDGTLDSKRYAQVDGVMKTSSSSLSSANSFSAKFAKFTKVLSVLGDVLQVLDAAIAIYRFNPFCVVLIKCG